MSLSEERYVNAGDFETASPAASQHARAIQVRAHLRRLSVLAACAFTSAAVLVLADKGDVQIADPGLANLLRGMAIIKTVILVCVGAAIWWRLGSPIGARLAAGYGVAAAMATGGAALVWSMTGLAIAPFLFDGGLLAFLVLALCDDNALWLRLLSRASKRGRDHNA